MCCCDGNDNVVGSYVIVMVDCNGLDDEVSVGYWIVMGWYIITLKSDFF